MKHYNRYTTYLRQRAAASDRRTGVSLCFGFLVYSVTQRPLLTVFSTSENKDAMKFPNMTESEQLRFEVLFECLSNCFLILNTFAPKI